MDETENLILGLRRVSIRRCPDGLSSAPLAKSYPGLDSFRDKPEENSVVIPQLEKGEDFFRSTSPDTREVSIMGELSPVSSEADIQPPFQENFSQLPPIGCERVATMFHPQEPTEQAEKQTLQTTPKRLPVIRVQGPTPRRSAFPDMTNRPFHPMRAERKPNDATDTPEMAAFRISKGFSANYHGNIYARRNKSAPISDNENCSLFITGLPVTVTVRGLLEEISNHGRVYALHINSPDMMNGHRHCAAKVIFFEALAAQKFLVHCNTNGLNFKRHTALAVHNRIKCAEIMTSRVASRVLLIYGPAEFVNPHFLTNFFSDLFIFEVDCIIAHGAPRHTPEKALVEYRFGSFRCQSQMAKKALRATFAGIVDVFYGEDPCALPPTVIPNERFLWTLFWCSSMQARSFLADVADQQTSAAILADQARRTGNSLAWEPASHPITVLE